MRGLKVTAIAAIALLLVMVSLVAYLFLTAEVQVVNISAEGKEINAEDFDALKTAIDQETFYGTLYQKPFEWKASSEYVRLTYKIKLRNNCLVPIDMIEVQVVPQADDILQFPDLDVKSLDLKSEGVIETSILAPKNTHSIRDMIVTYYLWGVSGNLKTVYGQ